MRQTFKSSPEMMTPIVEKPIITYPWRTMSVGTSFAVSYGEMDLQHLEYIASIEGKIIKAKFRVIDHGKTVGYEVGRIE